MKLTSVRYSIVSILLLTAVVALSLSLYHTNNLLRSASAGLSNAWKTRWPDPDHLNVLLTTEPNEIINYENRLVSAAWQALIPTTGSYCVRWRAGPEAATSSVVLPSGFSKIGLYLTESSEMTLNLEIEIDGNKIDDHLIVSSALIDSRAAFSIAGLGQTYSFSPTRRLQLFHLHGNDQNSQDAVEVWIEACVAKGTQQNSAFHASSIAPALPKSQPTESR